jgi:hypothetical protein
VPGSFALWQSRAHKFGQGDKWILCLTGALDEGCMSRRTMAQRPRGNHSPAFKAKRGLGIPTKSPAYSDFNAPTVPI